MSNTVTLEFAGDADKLKRAAAQASRATEEVGEAAGRSGDGMRQADQDASRFEQRMGNLGAATSGATDALDSLAGGSQAVADAMDYQRASAAKLERANIDVMQATEDMAQAERDAKQATIDSAQAGLDLEQARLDQATAQKEYNDAVKEHGKNSAEARQAEIDLKQAGIDATQAMEDKEQATRDASQAVIDARTGQVDLNDAMHEANPPDLQKFADVLNIVSPILSALVGIFGLVTAAQWLWNSALFASPITWIILGIIALIAIIVLLVKNWDKVKVAAGKAWDWIKDKAKSAWDWLKTLPGKIAGAFGKLGNTISAPFKAAFNRISDAWNNTVGALSWSVPGWVPGIGGNSISAPRLPKFHTGGVVPGRPGQEVPIMAMAGERVSVRGGSGGGREDWVRVDLGPLGAALIDTIAPAMRNQYGGRIEALGVRMAR